MAGPKTILTLFDPPAGVGTAAPNAPATQQQQQQQQQQRGDQPRLLTPYQLNFQARALLERNLGRVSVQGELVDFAGPISGHWYFSLKDGRATVRAVMWASDNARVRFDLANGMLVTAHGRVTLYEAGGTFQVQVTALEPAGAGAQAAALEALRRKLEKEGLFEPARKKPLPEHPRCVGVVTSPKGAALQDILKVLQRRAPHVDVLLSPARVQGQGAAVELRHALHVLAQSGRVDVIILGRGGGSAPDLAAFHDEGLVRAVAACRIPVVSAVGHETDRTLTDFVADRYASTPSAAAEMVTPSREQTLELLAGLGKRLHRAAFGRVQAARLKLLGLERRIPSARDTVMQQHQRLDQLEDRAAHATRARVRRGRDMLARLSTRLSLAHPSQQVRDRRNRLARAHNALLAASPSRRLVTQRQVVAALQRRMVDASHAQLRTARQRLLSAAARLDALSPLAVLTRGYALVHNQATGAVVRAPQDAPAGDTLHIRVRDGVVLARSQGPGPGPGEEP